MEGRDVSSRNIANLTRAELHTLVWQQPLKKLAIEFGISATELSAICRQNSIPCPPAGHWTRVALGQAAPPTSLPGTAKDSGSRVETRRSERKHSPRIQAGGTQPKSLPPATPAVPVDLSGLHRLIRSWVTEHQRLQSERAAEIRKGRGFDWFGSREIPDLTPRDVYRFRKTSDLLLALENAGVSISHAALNGKLSFTVAGHSIDCTVVEKMTRRLSENRNWTAFPDHHQGGLVPTGFLRIAITTYLRPAVPEWIETPQRKMNDLIPEIVDRVVGAAPILDRMEAEHREMQRKYAEEAARREEVARKRHLEKLRFERLGELANNWHRAQQLTSFIDELERRTENDREARLDGKSLAEWIEWARDRVAVLDPLQRQPADIFGLFVGDG